MGSGPRFAIGVCKGFGFAVYVDNFPHKVSLSITVLCFSIYLGFGKGYDE